MPFSSFNFRRKARFVARPRKRFRPVIFQLVAVVRVQHWNVSARRAEVGKVFKEAFVSSVEETDLRVVEMWIVIDVMVAVLTTQKTRPVPTQNASHLFQTQARPEKNGLVDQSANLFTHENRRYKR